MQTKYLIQNNDDAIIPEETDEVFKGETRKGNDKNCPFLLYFNDFFKVFQFFCHISYSISAIMIGLGAGLAGVLILVISLIICICMKNRNQEKAITPLNVVSKRGVVCSLGECKFLFIKNKF